MIKSKSENERNEKIVNNVRNSMSGIGKIPQKMQMKKLEETRIKFIFLLNQ